nr:hypothetical protein [Tanacetum cinerariifolium]
MSIQEMEDLKQQYFDEMKRLINLKYRDEIKIDELKGNFNITPSLSTEKPYNSLSMRDEHLDTIPEMDSDEEIESSVKKLNLTPSEFEDLFDYVSDDDESSSEEDVLVEHFKIYSNPLLEFDEEIFSSEINPLYNEVLEDLDLVQSGNDNHHCNIESNLIESLLNKDTVITSPKIDFNLEEFAGEPALINLIPPKIAETKFDPKVNICLIKKLLYDNSSPRPPEELNSKNDFEKENSGSTTIHTDISLLEYESFYDKSDSASKIFNDKLAHIISLPEYDCFLFKVEPNSRDFTKDVVEDIFSTKEPQVHNALPIHPNL